MIRTKKKTGFAASVGGMFLTKKNGFLPFDACADDIAVFDDEEQGLDAVSEKLGELLEGSYKTEVIPVRRAWVIA